MGALHSASPHPLAGMALFPRAPLRPPCPRPRVCALCHTARERSAFFWVAKPRMPPRPSAAGRSGLKLGRPVGGPGRVRGRGNGPGAPRGRGPLAGPGHSRGPHPRPRGLASAWRPEGVAGAKAGRAVFCDVGWPTPSPRQGSLPGPARSSPPDPRRMLGRGAPAGLVVCAPGIHISNAIFGAASTARRRRRALTTASACCVFFIWGWFAQGLPAGLLCPRGRPSTSAPCVSLSDAPVAPPEPSGAHTQGRFLSFLFPNESCFSKAGIEMKIARRTPKWSPAAAQPHPTPLPAQRAPPSPPGGAPRGKRAPERVFGEAGRSGGGEGCRAPRGRGSRARYRAPHRPRSGGAGAIGRARCVSASRAGWEPSPAAARNREDAARRPRPA